MQGANDRDSSARQGEKGRQEEKGLTVCWPEVFSFSGTAGEPMRSLPSYQMDPGARVGNLEARRMTRA
jgi:hypothetical protein